MHITQNIRNIQNELTKAQLMVVSKKRNTYEILECYRAGARLFGENRAQEVAEKWSQPPLANIRKNIQIHFIGHLQTNKVKQLCPLIDAIQSVDSVKLARKINTECAKISKTMPIFLEMNITNEQQKYGFRTDETVNVIKTISPLKNIKIVGLMCMAKHNAPESKIRQTFTTCKQLAHTYNLPQVSMGMSHDYSIALQEGTTLIRIGSKIFNETTRLLQSTK